MIQASGALPGNPKGEIVAINEMDGRGIA